MQGKRGTSMVELTEKEKNEEVLNLRPIDYVFFEVLAHMTTT